MRTRTLTFDYIYADTVRLGPGTYDRVDVFVDHREGVGERISDRGEQDLVKWVLEDEVRRRYLISKICKAPGRSLDGIQDREFQLSKTPQGGDLDLVVLEHDHPSQGVCVEFKKLKVRLDPDGEEKVNGLDKLEKLVAQGNARQSQGFWKTYICAIAVIDKHESEAANIFARRAESPEMHRFYNLDGLSGIHQDVGVLLLELSQPTGKFFGELFGLGICKVKEAAVLEQPARLTEDLQALFRQPMKGKA